VTPVRTQVAGGRVRRGKPDPPSRSPEPQILTRRLSGRVQSHRVAEAADPPRQFPQKRFPNASSPTAAQVDAFASVYLSSPGSSLPGADGLTGRGPARAPFAARISGAVAPAVEHDDQPGHSSRTFPTRDPTWPRSSRRDGRQGDGQTISRGRSCALRTTGEGRSGTVRASRVALAQRFIDERLRPVAEVALAAAALAQLRHGKRTVGIETLKGLSTGDSGIAFAGNAPLCASRGWRS
jgi:hypothetical protein